MALSLCSWEGVLKAAVQAAKAPVDRSASPTGAPPLSPSEPSVEVPMHSFRSVRDPTSEADCGRKPDLESSAGNPTSEELRPSCRCYEGEPVTQLFGLTAVFTLITYWCVKMFKSRESPICKIVLSGFWEERAQYETVNVLCAKDRCKSTVSTSAVALAVMNPPPPLDHKRRMVSLP